MNCFDYYLQQNSIKCVNFRFLTVHFCVIQPNFLFVVSTILQLSYTEDGIDKYTLVSSKLN